MVQVYILEILKYLIPPVIIFFTVRLVVKAYLANEEKKRLERNKSGNSQTLLPLRLQAYERLVLLLERVSPSQAVNRALQPGMTLYHFQMLLIQNIREEFEHNVTQQVYVSPAGWAMVKSAKEEVIRLINTSASELDAGAEAGELARKLLERWGQLDHNPIQSALDQLKAEARQNF